MHAINSHTFTVMMNDDEDRLFMAAFPCASKDEEIAFEARLRHVLLGMARSELRRLSDAAMRSRYPQPPSAKKFAKAKFVKVDNAKIDRKLEAMRRYNAERKAKANGHAI